MKNKKFLIVGILALVLLIAAGAVLVPMLLSGGGSVTKSHLILCDLMDCSTPGSSVLHYLPEFAQTYVHTGVLDSTCMC